MAHSSSAAAHPAGASRVIGPAPPPRPRRRDGRRALLHTVLAVWTQYLSLGCLLLYVPLRGALDVPLGRYSGPLFLLWPAAYLLLLASFCFDRLLWGGGGAPRGGRRRPTGGRGGGGQAPPLASLRLSKSW